MHPNWNPKGVNAVILTKNLWMSERDQTIEEEQPIIQTLTGNLTVKLIKYMSLHPFESQNKTLVQMFCILNMD